MSDAFTDVAKMKKIKEEIKAHEGQVVEMTLENGTWWGYVLEWNEQEESYQYINMFKRIKTYEECLHKCITILTLDSKIASRIYSFTSKSV